MTFDKWSPQNCFLDPNLSNRMGREEQSDPEGISAAVTAAGEHDDGETFKFEKKTFKKEEKK